MGNFQSGRKRQRQRVEETPRLDALDFCRAKGLPFITRSTPDGEIYFVGTCPQSGCGRAVRHLFQLETGVSCRQCAGLIYTRDSERHSVAEAVKRNPEAAGEAMATLQKFVATGEKAMFNEAMKTLAVAQHSPLDQLPSASDAEAVFAEEVRNRILADDLNTATGLVEIIKSQIIAGMENTTNRRGESLEIAMRGDTLAKLVSAWATVSNVRSNRAAQVAAILEKRAAGDDSLSLAAMMKEVMKDHITPSGHTMADLAEMQQRQQQPKMPENF